jgi:hypothetical protein
MTRSIAIACIALALAACQGTVLENAPGGVVSDCPEGWPGAWIGLDERGRDDDTGFLIEAGCTITVIDFDSDGEQRKVVLKPHFAGRDGSKLVLLRQDDVAKLFSDELRNIELDADALWPLRWGRDGDELVLVAPYHRRIAALIIEGVIDGETRWVARQSGLNRIRAEGAELDALLAADWFWGREDIPLRRVGENSKSLEAALGAVRARTQAEPR